MWLNSSSAFTGSNIEMASKLPSHTSQWSIHLELWKVVGIHWILDFGATLVWIPVISRRDLASSALSSNVSWRPQSDVQWWGHWLFDSQWTRFDDQVSVLSILHGYSVIWRSVSGHSKSDETRTFSSIFVKPGLMADTLLILVLAFFRFLWLLPMSMVSFSSNYWSCSLACQDLMQCFTPKLLMNAPTASCMLCAMCGIWSVNAGHSIPDASSIDCSACVVE